MIHFPQSKLPREFKNFLKNGENKTRLIELIFQVISQESSRALQMLKCGKIYCSKESHTVAIDSRDNRSSSLTLRWHRYYGGHCGVNKKWLWKALHRLGQWEKQESYLHGRHHNEWEQERCIAWFSYFFWERLHIRIFQERQI